MKNARPHEQAGTSATHTSDSTLKHIRPDGLNFTIFTSIDPPLLSKTFGLDDQGNLVKRAVASMWKGQARHGHARSLEELEIQLEQLRSDQAVGWGVTRYPHVDIVPSEEDAGLDPVRISRTRRNFCYSTAPGVMMFDHDGGPDGKHLQRDEFMQLLLEAFPELRGAPMLLRTSASGGLVHPDGHALTGEYKHRLYLAVSDASLILQAAQRFSQRLWARGFGWHEVGSAGQALPRTLVDTAVWQPERIDFAGAPVLRHGISRRVQAPAFCGDPSAAFDLRNITGSAGDERAAATRQYESKRCVLGRCKEQRERWAAEHAPALASTRGITEDEAHTVLTRAAGDAVLLGDFPLIASDGALVHVEELLADPKRWNGQRFYDPLDRDHDPRVAVANLNTGTRPRLFTFRHGGITFELRRHSPRVRVGSGFIVSATDCVLAILRDRGELFEFGDSIAYVADGRARVVSADWLADHLGRVCDFYAVGARGERAQDAPMRVARAILAKNGERGFDRLEAVITAPTMCVDGTILDQPGYHRKSRLLYTCDEPAPPRVPENPTKADSLAALELLWKPFSRLPVQDDISRAVLMHAILTAVMRPSLPTAPGVAFDAPVAGTGKTLIARAIGILATGEDPPLLPPTDSEEESRKRLFASLRDGARVIVWDNVREPLGGAALDAFMTAPTFRDRVLGASETGSVPNHALFIATGNNLRLTGDTCRRILPARLDAQMEHPFARQFDFCPAALLKQDRMRYVIAALTILRAYRRDGSPRVRPGRAASFEDWDDCVRQAIAWLNNVIVESGREDLPRFGDPLEATKTAMENDPQVSKHLALMTAWHRSFRGEPASVSAAGERANTDAELREAMEQVSPSGSKIVPRSIGTWIGKRLGQRIAGYWFERSTMSRGIERWIVKCDAQTATQDPLDPPPPPRPPRL